MEFEQLTMDVEHHIATITLNRPDRLNAFTHRMMEELVAAFDATDADDEVRAVIVTGAGRGFCAGADLNLGGDKTFAGGEERPDGTIPRDAGGIVSLRIFESLKPVIAAINGPAVGVGISITLPMDVRLASTGSKMGFVFNSRGIAPDAAASWFLPRVVGIGQAMEWVSTGRVFDAQEALAGGLVRSLHEPDELLPAAQALATEIAQNAAPVSVAVSRQLLWRMLGADHPMEAHKLDTRIIASRGNSEDAAEGIQSFFEKRPPDYPNRVSTDMPDPFPWWDERPFE